MTEWLSYLLKKKKELIFLTCLLVIQTLAFLPLIKEFTQPEQDFEGLKNEVSTDKKDNTLEFSFLEDFEREPIYFSKGGRDLFIKKSKKDNPDGEKKTNPGLSYVGLFRTEKEAFAVIRDDTKGKSHFRKEGEMVGNFKVVQIKKENVTLSDTAGKLINLPKGGKKP